MKYFYSEWLCSSDVLPWFEEVLWEFGSFLPKRVFSWGWRCRVRRRAQDGDREELCVCAATQILSVQVSRTDENMLVHTNTTYPWALLCLSGLCSCVAEDVEEAFVKCPDSRPLLLYLKTGERKKESDGVSCLSPATRELLERVNNADKSAKVKVWDTQPLGNA